MANRLRSIALASLVLLGTLGAGAAWLRQWLSTTLPDVRPPSIRAVFTDATPLMVTISVPGAQLPWPSTPDAIRSDVTVWRMMHSADWNRLPDGLRETGLEHMLTRFGSILVSPTAWDRMTAADWDRVPQPIRTVAYRHMAAYWAGYYDAGGQYGLPPGLVSDTIAAIVMSESWFDHRAVGVNRDGTRDIGLGGASEFARGRLRLLHGAGLVDVGPSDEDYFNPWTSTRFVAIWLRLMIGETYGDLDRAIGAYNRGIAAADDRVGLAYLAMVRRRRSVFIRNRSAPVAWDYLWRRAREIEREAWPWMQSAAAARPQRPPTQEEESDEGK
ncbi:MAG: transglycosylase SLT domain-containing protein [Vicinamibacteraceae bacterium]